MGLLLFLPGLGKGEEAQFQYPDLSIHRALCLYGPLATGL